jgi:hypothetical protein
VTEIDGSAFRLSGIESIEIEEGSVSFRVVNEFLVDFAVRSLVFVIGSPASIQIPSSIEELQPSWGFCKTTLGTAEFESHPTYTCRLVASSRHLSSAADPETHFPSPL